MFLPLGSNLPRKYFPWITLTWGIVCLVSFIFLTFPELERPYRETVTYQLSFIPAGNFDLFRMLSYQFMHSSWMHLLSNLWMWLVFGWAVESLVGGPLFLIAALSAGALAVIPEVIFQRDPSLPVVGSSGAVAFAVGALASLRPASQMRFLFTILPLPQIPMTFWVPTKVLVYFWLLLQVSGLAGNAWGPHFAPVAYATHLCGFALGLLGGFGFRYFEPSTPTSPIATIK